MPPDYTDSIVIEKEERKRSQILKSDEIPQENKDEIVVFLNKAKNLLIKNKKEEPIIKREITPIVHTKQEEFIPSNLNPLEKRTITIKQNRPTISINYPSTSIILFQFN